MIKNNPLQQLSFGVGIALALMYGINNSATAQIGTDDQGYQSNEKNGIYGDAPAGLNPLDLIHRAQQSGGRSAEEFNQESQNQLNNSASDFKRLQQQRILEQQQSRTTIDAEVSETIE
ncbi:MAG: hypothetical protein AAF652_14215 [Cyanobacteria bacterium P01_C01_bin.72]